MQIQVSKHLRRISHARTVWAEAYQNSTVLRPPGPLVSQSAEDLENLLTHASKLDANWTSRSPRPISHRTLADDLRVPLCMKLVLGRYLLVAHSAGLACYDLEAGEDWITLIVSYHIEILSPEDCEFSTIEEDEQQSVFVALRTAMNVM